MKKNVKKKRSNTRGSKLLVSSFILTSSFFKILWASEIGLILLTSTPVNPGSIPKCSRNCLFSIAWHDKPKEQKPTYLPHSSTPAMKCFITGTGIIYLQEKIQKWKVRKKEMNSILSEHASARTLYHSYFVHPKILLKIVNFPR